MSAEKVVALVGQPNAGKSTLFNVLSDIKTGTSNFAGTSVRISESTINVFGDNLKIIDLPGSYSLNYMDNAEKVTFNYITEKKIDLIINVVDAGLLARSLELTQELTETSIPMIIALNMMDEAKSKGLEIDPQKLSEILNIPVVPIVALYGKGVKHLIEVAYDSIFQKNYKPKLIKYTKHIEEHISAIERDLIENYQIQKSQTRFYAIKIIENPDEVKEAKPDIDVTRYNLHRTEIENEHNTDCFEAVSYERHHIAMSLAEKISKFTRKESDTLAEKLDRFLIHPVFGYFYLIMFFAVMFGTIFYVGSLLTSILDPVMSSMIGLYQPLKDYNIFLFLTVDGLAQGIAGGLGIVFPYFLPLILITSFFEETGYLARVAFLVDNILHKVGLHGKSVSAFILGIGCSVPAIYATRILESHRDRVLSAMLIPFVPCSARIAVIFALTAAFAGPGWAVVIFAFVLVVIGLSGKFLSKFLQKPTGLILEIPNLRIPSAKVALGKTYFKFVDFAKEALPFLVIGSIFLSWIEYFKISEYLDYAFMPILHYVLGLPTELGSTLLFGFFRKELVLVMATQALGVDSIEHLPMTMDQVIVFIVFVTLYFPCFTTFVVILKEFGTKVAVYSAALSLVLAIIGSLLFKIYFMVI